MESCPIIFVEKIGFLDLHSPGLGSRSRVFLAPWSRSPLSKKPGTGGGAAPKKNQEPKPQKIYRHLEDEKQKEMVHLLLFFR